MPSILSKSTKHAGVNDVDVNENPGKQGEDQGEKKRLAPVRFQVAFLS